MGVKDIKMHGAARAKIVAGVDTLASAVTVTYGPKGSHVMLDGERGFPIVTRDGLTVAREIELSCRFENAGASLVLDAATKASEAVGDGTTTAIVLTQAIVRGGITQVVAGGNPVGLKRGVDQAVAAAVEEIDRQSQRCSSKDDLARVAAISAGGDAEIGEMIGVAIKRVGATGVIAIEPGRGMSTELELVEGLLLDSGYISRSFINDQQTQKCILKDACVLICDKIISTGRQILHLLEAASKGRTSLLIIAEDVVGEALSTLAVNSLRGTLRVCAVRAPGISDRRADLLRDIAVVTGTLVVSPDFGMSLEGTQFDQLGRVDRVEVSPAKTKLVGAHGDADLIAMRAKQIRQRMEAKVSNFDISVLRDRLAKLEGGAAIIRVGGATEVEIIAKRSRIEGAVNATRAAMEEGVVPGGGVALIRAKRRLREMRGATEDETAGIRVVLRALEEPLRRLAANAGADASAVVGRVVGAEGTFGYDVATEQYGDLLELGIVDPAKVTTSALRVAASTAALIFINEAAIVEAPKVIRIHEHDVRICGCGCGDR